MIDMKKNKALVGVSAISVGLAIVFAVLTFMSWQSIDKSVREIENQKKKIENIKNASPHPVEENLEHIRKDIAKIEQKSKEATYVYGHPRQKVLAKFVSQLGPNATVDSFMTVWKEKMASPEPKLSDDASAQNFLATFLRDYTAGLYPVESGVDVAKVISNAKKTIIDYLHDVSVLDPTPAFVNKYLLQALDYPFNMQRMACNFLLTQTISKIHELLKSDTESPVITPSDDYYFLFEQFKTQPPKEGEIGTILTQLQMLEHVAISLQRAHVGMIKSFKRVGDFSPEPKNGMIKYSFELTVSGEFDNIRRFINQLADGISCNHFYHIRSLALTKVVDEEKDLFDTEKQKSKADRDKKAAEKVDDDDGAPKIEKVVGQNNMVQAVILFDYLVYVGGTEAQKGGE